MREVKIEEGFITQTSRGGAEILTLVQLTDWNGTLGIEAWGATWRGARVEV